MLSKSTYLITTLSILLLGGCNTLGYGVTASQTNGSSGTIDFHLITDAKSNPMQLSRKAGGAITPLGTNEFYVLRLSPDNYSKHALAFGEGRADLNEARVEVFEVRTGIKTALIANNLDSLFRKNWDELMLDEKKENRFPAKDIESTNFFDAYWTNSNAIVLRYDSSSKAEMPPYDLLVRINLADIEPNSVSDSTAMFLHQDDAAPNSGNFMKRIPLRQRNDTITLNGNGEFILNGSQTTGGPSKIKRYDAVVF